MTSLETNPPEDNLPTENTPPEVTPSSPTRGPDPNRLTMWGSDNCLTII